MMSPCVVWVASAGADLASTEYALQRGAVEVNPLQATPAGRVVMQTVYATTGCVVDKELRKHHPGWAKALRITFFIGKLALAAHNVRSVR